VVTDKPRKISFVRTFPDGSHQIGVVFWSDHGDEITVNTFDHSAGPAPHHAIDLSYAEEEVLYRLLRKRRKLRRERLANP
jgi:hypothetical protein